MRPEARGKFVERSRKDGTLVDSGGLLPSKDGVRVRLESGKVTVTDGPFSESEAGRPQPEADARCCAR